MSIRGGCEGGRGGEGEEGEGEREGKQERERGEEGLWEEREGTLGRKNSKTCAR